MTDWWSELENELLSCVEEIGLATPAEVGRRLGFSETSAASLLAILVREGCGCVSFRRRAGRRTSRRRARPNAHEIGHPHARVTSRIPSASTRRTRTIRPGTVGGGVNTVIIDFGDLRAARSPPGGHREGR